MENFGASQNKRAAHVFGAPGDGSSFPRTTAGREEALFRRWVLKYFDQWAPESFRWLAEKLGGRAETHPGGKESP